MQIPLRTSSGAAAYVANREWRTACLHTCPLHPAGGCSFARHGSYPRVTPRGVRIARWYCPEGHCTFSLLPDFLAARLPGLLSDVDAAYAEAKSARSLEAATDALRGCEVSLPSALRWLHRRMQAVCDGMEALSQLEVPATARSISCCSALPSLLGLRRSLSPRLLQCLPPPLGFLSDPGAACGHDDTQHDMGPDGGPEAVYVEVFQVGQSPCNARPPPVHKRPPFRRSPTYAAFGVPIVACKTAALASISGGSIGSALTVKNASSTSGPN